MPDFAQQTDFSVALPSGPVLRGSVDGDGEPILLLHGLSATRRYVTQGSKRLTREGFRLIGYDARAHGESDPAPDSTAYTYADQADDVAVVLDELGIDRAVLAGSSMGAHVSLTFALANPERVRALVLITPAFTGAVRSEAELGSWDRLAEALAAGDLDLFAELSAQGLDDSVADTVRLAVRQRVERHRHPAAVADVMRVLPRSKPLESLDDLARIGAPTLVVGSRDHMDTMHPLAVAEEYAQRIPGAALKVEEEGRTPLAWQGGQLSKAIGEFLAGNLQE